MPEQENTLNATENVANEHELITLSLPDWTLFAHALENPPTISAKLQDALALHKRILENDEYSTMVQIS